MGQIKIYMAILAIANFVFVLSMAFGPHWFVYLATFTALNLFAFGIGSKRSLRTVGAIFNFFGVVAGGLAGATPVMYMALFGCQLLLADHIAELFSTRRIGSQQ